MSEHEPVKRYPRLEQTLWRSTSYVGDEIKTAYYITKDLNGLPSLPTPTDPSFSSKHAAQKHATKLRYTPQAQSTIGQRSGREVLSSIDSRLAELETKMDRIILMLS